MSDYVTQVHPAPDVINHGDAVHYKPENSITDAGLGYEGSAPDALDDRFNFDSMELVGAHAHGEISVVENSSSDSVDDATWTQVTRFNTNGLSRTMTPDHTEDHIVVSEAGIYHIMISCAFSGDASVDWSFKVFCDNGTIAKDNVHTNRKLGGGGDIGSMSLNGLVQLTAGNTVELWMKHSAGVSKALVIEDCTMTLIRIG